MSIPAIGVSHPIEILGVKASGHLDDPHNATGAVGWYSIDWLPEMAIPGTGGNAVFSGHINYNGANGPFAYLSSLEGGADIYVTLSNGAVLQYQVFANRRYVTRADYETAATPLINMDNLVFTPDRTPGEEWITLITCSCEPGRFIPAPGSIYGECVDRDVVIARRVG